MEKELTTWGYLDENGVEILDFNIHKETDKGRGINSMIKNSGYFLSRIIPYIQKNKNGRVFRLDNISEEEAAILYYLDMDEFINPIPFDNELRKSKLSIRDWIEQKLSNNPALINTLWTLDHKGVTPKPSKIENIPLTNITSYSRPELLAFDEKVYKNFEPVASKIVILPCTQSKPYHKRKYKVDSNFTKISGGGKMLLQSYINDEDYDNIVLTSAGLIPQEFWEDEIVMNYDTGVRDMWKLLCLTKRFFEKNEYDKYVVIVKFKPYRDILRNLVDMGVIDRNKIEFVGEDENPNGLRIMFYPKSYALYPDDKNKQIND